MERGNKFQFHHNRLHRKSVFLKLCIIKGNKLHLQHNPHPFHQIVLSLKSYLYPTSLQHQLSQNSTIHTLIILCLGSLFHSVSLLVHPCVNTTSSFLKII